MDFKEDIFRFVLKAFLFSAIFWLSWIFLFRSISIQNSNTSVVSQVNEYEQDDKYDQQLKKAEEQLAITSEQQRRMNELISKWEMQSSRYDLILSQWEKRKVPGVN